MSEPIEAEYNVPSEENITEAVESYEPIPRNYVEEPENLAGEEELVKKYTTSVSTFYNKYIGSASRKDLETYLKDSDAKWRIAQSASEQYKTDSSQKQNTLSRVASEQFFNSVKLIHSAITSILFGDGEEKPARYEPVRGSNDYTPEEGKRIAQEQTAYWEAIYDADRWDAKLKSSMLWMCKNAHELISVQWMYRTKKAIERLPGYYTSDGTPVEAVIGEPVPEEMFDVNGKQIDKVYGVDGRPRSYVFADKTRIVQNHPIFARYGLKNSLFDLEISGDSFNDCMQKQSCVIMWDDVTFADLLAGERDGLYMNVDKVTKSLLYDGTDEDTDNIRHDQLDNAGQTEDQVQNGLYRRYHVYHLAPIDYDKKEWDIKSIPEITESVFIGKMSAGTVASAKTEDGKEAPASVLCLMLRKLPYHHGRYPLKLVSSMEDDKAGALKIGYYNLLECNIEEQTTTLNQHIDNKTLKIKTPFVGERGNVLSRELIFKNGNQVLWVKPGTGGTALTQLKIDDMTNSTLPLLEYLKNAADETLNTTDVIKGAFAGSRTTGTEVLSVREQALQPLIENSKYVAEQYFGFILRDFADLSRQYADPNNPLILAGDSEAITVSDPAQLYGNYKVKIVSVEKFKADLTAKNSLNEFIQGGGYDKATSFMQESGALHFWRTWARFNKMPDVLDMFPAAKKNVEAENQAWADVEAILENPEFAMQSPVRLPKAGEAHDIHIKILQSQKELYRITESAKENGANTLILAAFDLYIRMHEDLKVEEESQVQASQQPQGQGDPSTMSGEQSGDALAGAMGQQAPEV